MIWKVIVLSLFDDSLLLLLVYNYHYNRHCYTTRECWVSFVRALLKSCTRRTCVCVWVPVCVKKELDIFHNTEFEQRCYKKSLQSKNRKQSENVRT